MSGQVLCLDQVSRSLVIDAYHTGDVIRDDSGGRRCTALELEGDAAAAGRRPRPRTGCGRVDGANPRITQLSLASTGPTPPPV